MRTGSLILATLSTACLSHPALAQFQQTRYDIQHTFNWMPPPGVTQLPTVTGVFFQHAWVRERGGFQGWGAAPLPQAPGFDPYGRDFGVGMGMVHIPQVGPAVPCLLGSFIIPPTGLSTGAGGSCLLVQGNSSHAVACVAFDILPYAVGTPIAGTIRSAGGATASGPGAEAYASSAAGLSIRDASTSGQIQWQPFMDIVSGSAYAQAQRRDPIEITATDIAGNTASSVVLEIDFTTDSAGTMSWSSGVLSIDALQGRFLMRVGGTPIRNPGTLLLEIENGIVTRSRSNGSLAFPLPAVGTPIPVSAPIPNTIPIDYDTALFALPDPIGDVTLAFLGNGEGPLASGCAADWNGDGNVDPDDLGDFINCFFSVPPCDRADFNTDGNIDPDDLGDFINVFFGEPCG